MTSFFSASSSLQKPGQLREVCCQGRNFEALHLVVRPLLCAPLFLRIWLIELRRAPPNSAGLPAAGSQAAAGSPPRSAAGSSRAAAETLGAARSPGAASQAGESSRESSSIWVSTSGSTAFGSTGLTACAWIWHACMCAMSMRDVS